MKNKVTLLCLGFACFAIAVVSLSAIYSHLTLPGRQSVDGTIIGVLDKNRFEIRILCRYKVGDRTYVCPVVVDRKKNRASTKKGDHLDLYFNPDSPADISLNPKKKEVEHPVLYALGAVFGLGGAVWFFKSARAKPLP